MLISFLLDVGLGNKLCTINIILNIHFCELGVALRALFAIHENLNQAFLANSMATVRDPRLIYASIISDHADWAIKRLTLHPQNFISISEMIN